jgi:hypothetical protein
LWQLDKDNTISLDRWIRIIPLVFCGSYNDQSYLEILKRGLQTSVGFSKNITYYDPRQSFPYYNLAVLIKRAILSTTWGKLFGVSPRNLHQ